MEAVHFVLISFFLLSMFVIIIILVEINKTNKLNNSKEKSINVPQGFPWPQTTPPTMAELTNYVKYRTEPSIGNKLLVTEDTDRKHILYFDNNEIKDDFLKNVNKFDFSFYYTNIKPEEGDKEDIYYIPKDYIHSNLLSNIKPADTNYKYNLGLVLSKNTTIKTETKTEEKPENENKREDFYISNDMMNLYNHITSNNLYWNFIDTFDVKFIKIYDEYKFNNSLISQIILVNINKNTNYNLISKGSFGYLFIEPDLTLKIITDPTITLGDIGTREISSFGIGKISSDYQNITFNDARSGDYFMTAKINLGFKIGNNFNVLKYNTINTNLPTLTIPITYGAYYDLNKNIRILNYELTKNNKKYSLNSLNNLTILFENKNDLLFFNQHEDTNNFTVLIVGNDATNNLHILYVPSYIQLDYSYILKKVLL